jgi:putative transcriptional regulator
MKNEDFAKLVASVREAGEIKAGRRKPARKLVVDAPAIKSVRRKLGVSQRQFALMIGVSLRTLQNWEQGRRQPDGPAQVLLRVASRSPKAILEAVHT